MTLSGPSAVEYDWNSGLLKPSLATGVRPRPVLAIIVFPNPTLALGDWT